MFGKLGTKIVLSKDTMIKTLDEKDEHNQKFFNTDSKAISDISNAAFEFFIIICDNNQDLKEEVANTTTKQKNLLHLKCRQKYRTH